MIDLSVEFAGLSLKNPIIAGSCGLTGSVDRIIEMEKHGAAAVVLKSIFEEDINHEYKRILSDVNSFFFTVSDTDYLDFKIKQDITDQYIELIQKIKSKVSIPIIASIHCISGYEWDFFAEKLELAGADALELNISPASVDSSINAQQIENSVFEIINKTTNRLKIPVIVKTGHYYTDMARMIKRISETNIKGLVLFNRYWSPDIDIYEQKITSGKVLSSKEEYQLPLRWIALSSGIVSCDLAASTGIYNGESVIKQILAGASAVQIVSAMYDEGIAVISEIIDFLEQYLHEKKINHFYDIKGKLNYSNVKDPAMYERIQFMKHFNSKESI